jgi:hypothetical protein
MSGREIVASYIEQGYRPVFWPAKGDQKGPTEPGWNQRAYTLADYHEGDRVGLMTGVEIAPGQFLTDIDIDWAPGIDMALQFLPPTQFIVGRPSKKVSHCFYLVPELVPSFAFKDIDGSTLIELRGCKHDGTPGGCQSMVPPSIWTKGDRREALDMVKNGRPALIGRAALERPVTLGAISLLLGKHLGQNGFGHDPRLAWAGFLLALDLSVDELVSMGEALSRHCNNTEISDVRRVVESTARLLREDKKVKGGPSLAQIFGADGRRIITLVRKWLGSESEFVRHKNNVIWADHQGNVESALEQIEATARYDEFARKVYLQWNGSTTPLDDARMVAMRLEIDRRFGFRPSKEFFHDKVGDLARHNSVHPVREYFAALQWDGTPRLDQWLTTYGGAKDTPLTRAIGAIVLIAVVQRVRRPGCKFDELLILLSVAQGMNKSSAIQALCPNPEWFSDDLPLNVDAKETIERTTGKLIIEAAELSGFPKRDIEHLKSWLSRGTDGPARMAYGRESEEVKRQFIVIGTTNALQFLKDSTGNRRFWPVAVQRFDLAALAKDRDQLWAEAAVREARGESIRLPEEYWEAAAIAQERRQQDDPWLDILRDAFDTADPPSDRILLQEVWTILGIFPDHQTESGRDRIDACMRRLGFEQKKARGSKGEDKTAVRMRWCRMAADANFDATALEIARKEDDEEPEE